MQFIRNHWKPLAIILVISCSPIVLLYFNIGLPVVEVLGGIWVLPLLILDWELCGWLVPGKIDPNLCEQIYPLFEFLVFPCIFIGNFLTGLLLWLGGRKLDAWFQARKNHINK